MVCVRGRACVYVFFQGVSLNNVLLPRVCFILFISLAVLKYVANSWSRRQTVGFQIV